MEAAYLTEYLHPRWSFAVSCLPSLVLLIVSLRLKPSIEAGDSEEVPESLAAEFKKNMREIVTAIKIPIFHRVMIFLALTGLIPSFGTFGYYFMLDVVHISKFTYSLLGVLGFFCLMVGSATYQHTGLSRKEFRTLILYDMAITYAFSPLGLMFVYRINESYGLPDMLVIVFTDIVSSVFSQCLIRLPMMVLFAKITPKNVEATAFALLTGTSNFTANMSGLVGTGINSAFVGVTKDDLSKYPTLVLIKLCISITPLAYLWLLPSREELLVFADESSRPSHKLKGDDSAETVNDSAEIVTTTHEKY